MEDILVGAAFVAFVFTVVMLFERLALELRQQTKIERMVERKLNMEPPVVTLDDGRRVTISSRGEIVPAK